MVVRSPIRQIAIVAVYIAHVALFHQGGIILGSPRNALPTLVDMDDVDAQTSDRFHREEELCRTQSKEPTGRYFEETYLVLLLIDEQLIYCSQFLARHVQDFQSPDILGPIGQRQVRIT